MPCFRCGARQSDPERGPSSWRRAVRGRRQVLICPGCQEGDAWRAAVEACPACGSTDLARRLGQTVCTRCLTLVHADLSPVVEPTSTDDLLSRDVADAIERVLRH